MSAPFGENQSADSGSNGIRCTVRHIVFFLGRAADFIPGLIAIAIASALVFGFHDSVVLVILVPLFLAVLVAIAEKIVF
ncbi:hypothetical protein [Natronorarus salvus]|uniref:hypothetical protein n=1 Tax=Natronorarus salvus TaxID=3117733 RepID=UPI002F26650D